MISDKYVLEYGNGDDGVFVDVSTVMNGFKITSCVTTAGENTGVGSDAWGFLEDSGRHSSKLTNSSKKLSDRLSSVSNEDSVVSV